jgi:hypothetical protein
MSDGCPDCAVTHTGADSVSILINNTAILASCVDTGAARLRGWVRRAAAPAPRTLSGRSYARQGKNILRGPNILPRFGPLER